MEERADVMTDNQYYGILKMVYMLLRDCKSINQGLAKLLKLMREVDREELKKEEPED